MKHLVFLAVLSLCTAGYVSETFTVNDPLNLENTFKTVRREMLKSKTTASYIGKLRDAYLVYSLKSQGCQPRPRKSRTCGRWALAASRPAS